MTYEHGYPAGEFDRWCLRVPGAGRSLCGRPVRDKQVVGRFYDVEDVLAPSWPGSQCPQCAAAEVSGE